MVDVIMRVTVMQDVKMYDVVDPTATKSMALCREYDDADDRRVSLPSRSISCSSHSADKTHNSSLISNTDDEDGELCYDNGVTDVENAAPMEGFSHRSCGRLSSLSSALLSFSSFTGYFSGCLSNIDDDEFTFAMWARCVAHIGDSPILTPWHGHEDILDSLGYGELADKSLPVANLKNSIHPLISTRAFIEDSYDITAQSRLWDGLRPALQLASRMLISAPVMAILRRRKYGQEIPHRHGSRTPGFRSYYKIVKPSTQEDHPSADACVMQDLMRLARKLRFVFGAIKPGSCDAAQIHALHCVSPEEVGRRAFVRCDPFDIPMSTYEYHYIAINETYGQYFKHAPRRTLSRDRRPQWSLAVTLIHEMIHAYYARDRVDGKEGYHEPWYDRASADIDEQAELGN